MTEGDPSTEKIDTSKTTTEEPKPSPSKEPKKKESKGFNYKALASDTLIRKALENLGLPVINADNIDKVITEFQLALKSIGIKAKDKELSEVIKNNSSRGASATAYEISVVCGCYS